MCGEEEVFPTVIRGHPGFPIRNGKTGKMFKTPTANTSTNHRKRHGRLCGREARRPAWKIFRVDAPWMKQSEGACGSIAAAEFTGVLG